MRPMKKVVIVRLCVGEVGILFTLSLFCFTLWWVGKAVSLVCVVVGCVIAVYTSLLL